MRAPRVSSTRWATQSTRAVSDNGCGSAVRSPTGPSVPPPQFTVVPERLAVPPPDELGDDVGAALGIPGITAHRAVFSDGPVGGKTLLVHGVLGGVSSLAAQLARWGGATVIATVTRSSDLARVDPQTVPGAGFVPIQLDPEDGVATHGQVVDTRARLRIAVDDYHVRDLR